MQGNNVIAGKICPLAQHAIHSRSEAEALAANAASIYKLSPIPLQCVVYESYDDGEKNGKKGPYAVLFRERHTPECGGDPNTEPRLFTILVTSKGKMTTDAYDKATGTFRKLRCPK